MQTHTWLTMFKLNSRHHSTSVKNRFLIRPQGQVLRIGGTIRGSLVAVQLCVSGESGQMRTWCGSHIGVPVARRRVPHAWTVLVDVGHFERLRDFDVILTMKDKGWRIAGRWQFDTVARNVGGGVYMWRGFIVYGRQPKLSRHSAVRSLRPCGCCFAIRVCQVTGRQLVGVAHSFAILPSLATVKASMSRQPIGRRIQKPQSCGGSANRQCSLHFVGSCVRYRPVRRNVVKVGVHLSVRVTANISRPVHVTISHRTSVSSSLV